MSQSGNKLGYIDMKHAPSAVGESPHGTSKSCSDQRFVTVDLGQFYEVGEIQLWNYYGDKRRYCGQALVVSNTGAYAGEQVVVWRPREKFGPWETAKGNRIRLKTPIVTRFIRYYCARNSRNHGVHMLEMDVLGLPTPLRNPLDINLNQLPGVRVAVGPGLVQKKANCLIDTVTSPQSYAMCPHSTSPLKHCQERRYVTIDLTDYFLVDGVRIFNYHADSRRYCGQRILLSETGEFKGEEVVVYDTKGNYGPQETNHGNLHGFKAQVARFVRYESSGNNKNNYAHMVEIDVLGQRKPVPHLRYVNLANLAGVHYTLGPGLTEKKQGCAIDQKHDNSAAICPYGKTSGCTDPKYLTVDLGAYYEVGAVRLWHYHADLRAYCGQRIEVSTSGEFAGEQKVVWKPLTKYGEKEQASGSLHRFSPVASRYVRWYSAGNTQNPWVHLIEIKILGLPQKLKNVEWINLDQVRGATVIPGPGIASRWSQGYIDMNHDSSSYTKAPGGHSSSCKKPLFVTVDLGKIYMVHAIGLCVI